MKKFERSGFSILEAVVVIFLIGLIFGLFVSLFAFGNRLMQRGGKRVDVSRAQTGLSREFRNFGGSPRRLVTIHHPSGDPTVGDLVISFPSYRMNDGTRQSDPQSGQPLVQSFEIYYRNTAEQLMFYSLPIIPSADPIPPDTLQLQAVVDDGLGRVRIEKTQNFQLIHPDSGEPTWSVSGLTEIRVEAQSTDGQTVSLGTHLRLLPH